MKIVSISIIMLSSIMLTLSCKTPSLHTVKSKESEKLEEIIQLDTERLELVRSRLEKSIAELKFDVDENRFEQELIYYLEKLDITEEKVRLNKHLEHFEEVLSDKESKGKKLGFIGQEIGREINTIGSKANFAPMQRIVVEMKDELEKIKEQLLNVL